MGHFTRLHTHFPTDEDYRDTGRYADEVRRAEEITAEAGDHTLAFLNETFSGTDEVKSADASRKLAQTLYDTGTFGVYVTHLHELTGGDIPTLAAVIDESDNNRRTYRIVRMHRTDSSHAADILYRYGLTREQLRGKLAGKEEPK
jgi:DNA mismatch repair ATPase MutS